MRKRCGVVQKADLLASLVVFLVALPLCVGVAIASGVPAELGLVTGIVGGLVAGALPGSSLQVSGPAAGLTVLVYEAVHRYGVQALGVLVFGAGLVQLGLGALRLGRWFRAVSMAVVQGMLAGIGLVLIAGQVYALGDMAAPAGGLGKLAGLVSLPGQVDPVALSVGGATIAVLLLWPRWRRGARVVPAPLVAVAVVSAVTGVFGLGVRRVEVRGLLDAVRVPEVADFGRLTEVGVIGTVVAFALIASAESLFSAAAMDRLHRGPRTDYDRELLAQGAGNAVCGLLGALPMTAVIVRSTANVHAGARTKASRLLHGVWLLLFAVVVPGVLGVIPVAALAGLLVHAGCKLVPVREVRGLWRGHRGEVVVLVVTAGAIVVGNLFEGVLVGLTLAVAKTAWDVSHVHVETEDRGAAGIVVRVLGHATFLRLPKLLDALEALPVDREVRLELGGLRHLDHACAAALEGWAAARGQEPVATSSSTT
ncbi:SulP family inorganic anion transporter [Streptomyces pseudovenezuelae]|uniref:MFS superfamily sulfate permease-like transporter n=1 Tax=Streptomyces pseudovenezuelae TaxID=67350 RepID=A0ABT6LDZ9_9ACTN|nr:SulP family inorganic anion transporter [Streptomyces pseudovenezuelae]MDH6214527.1 MFS superfamily sulfate permease-like transporter [Streptomyces pseudovenezuelae]